MSINPSISTGKEHACALFYNMKLKCWGFSAAIGNDKHIGLEDYDLGSNLPYIDPGTGYSIIDVSCGGYHTCMVLNTQDMKCFGSNDYGETGIGSSLKVIGEVSNYNGDTLPAVNLGDGVKALDVVTGLSHTCAKVSGNKVKCFGRNNSGQLGLGNSIDVGTVTTQMGNDLAYVDLGKNYEVKYIFSGSTAAHTCIIYSAPSNLSGKMVCFGAGTFNQLGNGSNRNVGDNRGEMGDNLNPVDLGNGEYPDTVAIGSYHTCVITLNGLLKCWGWGFYGQLGSGSSTILYQTGSSLPYVALDKKKFAYLTSAGESHTCVVFDDKATMKCVGDNDYGQLGQGDTLNRGNSPTTILDRVDKIDLGNGTTIASIRCGGSFTCVLFLDQRVKCFGKNTYGQLAIGSNEPAIGDEIDEMGNNLKYAEIEDYLYRTLSPTQPQASGTIVSAVFGVFILFMIVLFVYNLVYCNNHKKDSSFEWMPGPHNSRNGNGQQHPQESPVILIDPSANDENNNNNNNNAAQTELVQL